MEPAQTGFFQALGIATKITKGSIEVVKAFKLCIAGEPVGERKWDTATCMHACMHAGLLLEAWACLEPVAVRRGSVFGPVSSVVCMGARVRGLLLVSKLSSALPWNVLIKCGEERGWGR